jgi:hypothetical protein
MSRGHERDFEYRVTISYGQYGLPYVEPVPGAKLRVDQRGSQVSITGNSEGLLCLARHLIGLAHLDRGSDLAGYHIHVESECGLDEGTPLIVYREESDA